MNETFRRRAPGSPGRDTELSPEGVVDRARDAFRESLLQLGHRYGLDHVLVCLFPRGDKTGFSDTHLVSNWPRDLAEAYHEADVFHSCYLTGSLKRTVRPVVSIGGAFTTGVDGASRRGPIELFCRYGLRVTVGFSLHDADQRHYLLAFSGRDADVTEAVAMELMQAALCLLDEAQWHIHAVQRPVERLSLREVECLRWSAAGKSSGEIAIILDISAHTVSGYLKAAMRKLDSVSRMQAVARAYRYRLL